MKKALIILTTLTLFFACKKDNEKIVGTNEKGESLVVNENGDTISVSTNETINDDPEQTVVSTALSKNEDQTYSFQYNLKKGETYPFLLKITQEQALNSAGQSMKLNSSRTVQFDYLVEDVIGTTFKIKATFKRFAETFNGPSGEKMAYDTSSAKPSDKDIAQSWKIYKAIVGENFQMEIDNKGKVVSVNGLKNIVSNVEGKLANDFTGDEKKLLKELLSSSLSTEAIKSQFEESLNIFPDKSLKIGEQWSDSQNISEGPIKGTNKVTRTFKGVDNGLATITVNGTQNVSGSDTQQGITMNMTNKASLNGKIDLDLESGWIKKVSLTKKESINTTYQQGEQKQSESGTSTTVTTVN